MDKVNKYTIIIKGTLENIVPDINKVIEDKKRKLKKKADFVIVRMYG